MEKKVNKSKKCDCGTKSVSSEKLNKVVGGEGKEIMPCSFCFVLDVYKFEVKPFVPDYPKEQLDSLIAECKRCRKEATIRNCDDNCEFYKFWNKS